VRIATIVGARPQFIKAAVVSRAMEERGGIEEIMIHTGQHYNADMSDIFFKELDIRQPDHHLGIGGGTHGQNTGRMVEAAEAVLAQTRPDWVLVYGDTDSTLAGALAAVKLHIPVAHVESGLRSFNRRMPEEINRVLTDHIAELLLVPTQTAVRNLAAEGIGGNQVCMVGDVMYDASLYYRKRMKQPAIDGCPDSGFVLCTIHRAENTDDAERMNEIIRALNEIAHDGPIILPIHPRTVKAIGTDSCGKLHSNIFVVDPVGFLEMNWLLDHCSLVMTDSGGLQKEAYFHGKPCVTLRDETEWVELVESGCNKLAPPGEGDIVGTCNEMRNVSMSVLPLFGNGDAATLIVDSFIQA
jgi:UDP-GlcNAc3NAcA epimerase